MAKLKLGYHFFGPLCTVCNSLASSSHVCLSSHTFHRLLKTQAFSSPSSSHKCLRFGWHCALYRILFTYLLTYLMQTEVKVICTITRRCAVSIVFNIARLGFSFCSISYGWKMICNCNCNITHKHSYTLTLHWCELYSCITNEIHVQTNRESVQCLSKKWAYHNKVHVTREQLS